LFITFEGGEGSGKSWQTRALYRKLCRLSIPAVLIHEPGCTPLGERLGRLLKWGRGAEISPLSELMLFNAARTQLVADVIQPGLGQGKIVICDRFADSTIAYQGCGRGLDVATVSAVNKAATGNLNPDLTILLDIPVEKGLARKSAREINRFEKEDIAFHKRVRTGFLSLSLEEPDRFLVIDAMQSKSTIAHIIWDKVSLMLSRVQD
jgi:dTMP kinase